MTTRRMLFAESPHLGFESRGGGACGCGGTCGGCTALAGFAGVGDYSETTDPRTGVTTSEYKSGGVDPAMGSKMVFEALSDLFTGRKEKESARSAAERLAQIQAQTDQATLAQRAIATERWTAVAPWALMGISVIGVGIILLKVSKK